MKRVDQFRFRILDNSPEGVILLDASLRIIYLNKMVEHWTGLTLESVEGLAIFDVFPHLSKPAYQNRLKQVLDLGFPLVLSSQLHPNLIPFDDSLKPRVGQTILSRVDESDTSEKMLRVSLMDMTAAAVQYQKILALQKISRLEIEERRKAQDALMKERAELQTANASKDKFFSILAHDLRGPLGGLVSMSETMLDDFDMFDITEIKDIVRIMHHSSDQVFELLKNLLTWSRLNTGRIEFNPELIRLKSVVTDLTALFEAQVVKKELKLQFGCSDDLLVYVDSSMFETVMRNLLSNAIKFTPRSGQLNIKCYPDSDLHSTVIEVADTGVGMTPEVLGKVFDVSSKHHTPGTENEASSGLGLVLVKEFVERNSGLLHVESEPGFGTTFRCTFPAQMP